MRDIKKESLIKLQCSLCEGEFILNGHSAEKHHDYLACPFCKGENVQSVAEDDRQDVLDDMGCIYPKDHVAFKIEDIDGCEFVKCSQIGKLLISNHQDFDGFYTGKIHVVYPDGSHGTVSEAEAQKHFNIGQWKVIR